MNTYQDGKKLKENILEESISIETRLFWEDWIREDGFKLNHILAVEDGLFDLGSFKHSIEMQFAHQGIQFDGKFFFPRPEDDHGEIELCGSIDRMFLRQPISLTGRS